MVVGGPDKGVPPKGRGTLVVPVELEWIIQCSAPDLTSRSLQKADATIASLQKGSSTLVVPVNRNAETREFPVTTGILVIGPGKAQNKRFTNRKAVFVLWVRWPGFARIRERDRANQIKFVDDSLSERGLRV